jgi:TonB family protein
MFLEVTGKINFMKKVLIAVCIYIISGTSSFAQEGLVVTKYANGKTESEINYSNNIRVGEAKYYYENGNIKEERLYINGRVEGLVKKYHENGKLKELINIENGKREGPTSIFNENGEYVTDIFFENGKQFIEEKNPYIIEEPKTDIATTRKIKKQEKVNYELPPPQEEKEEKPEDDDAILLIAEVMPEPVGGPGAIQKKIVYPPKAKEDGIQGIVEIEAFIDEFGEVTKAIVKKGIGHGCDESARIAVYYTKFKPGLQKGKPVKMQMVIPLEFKLLDVIGN